MWSGKSGRIDAVEHCIDLTKDSRSFCSAPYLASPSTRELEEQEVQKQLEAGVIESATSECASPVLFVSKKDELFRFCTDYRRSNVATIIDTYPLLTIDDYTNFLGSAKISITLDANSDDRQIPVLEEDQNRTASDRHAGFIDTSKCYLVRPTHEKRFSAH